MTSPYRAAERRDGMGIKPGKGNSKLFFQVPPSGTADDPANGSSSSDSLERESGGRDPSLEHSVC